MSDDIQKPLGSAKATGHYVVRCIGPDGKEKWVEKFDNLVVDEGLNYILETALANETAQVTTWYVGLLEASPSPAAGWTKTEVGAADFVDYDEANLVAWVPEAVASKSVANDVTTADFAINQDASSIGGAYLASANTKAVEGGAAIIYSAGAFTGGNKAADSGDTLQVTATFTQADA